MRGVRDVAERAATVVSRWIRARDQLVVYGIDPATAAPREIAGASFRPAVAADASRYARDVGTESTATFARRLTPANRCFLVEMDERIVHASWFTTSSAWVGEMGAYLVFPPHHGYVYESFTDPGARGRGLYPFALTQLCRTVAEDGCSWVWVVIEEHNAASRRAVEKAGFERIYSIAFQRRLGSVSHQVVGEREEVVPRISPHPA